MFRREWRQQLVLVALLTLTVAAALVLITASYHADRPAQAQFGTATQLIRYPSDPPEVSQRVAAAQAWFGTIDVIGHQSAPIPGLNQSVEIRSQDPHGPYGGPMLRLVSGRYPTGAGEAAVTDEVATLTSVRVGGWLALDGHSWTVVGLVENPGNLDAEFVLVPPAAADPPPAVTILTAASQQRFDEFLGDRDEPEVRDQNQRTVAAAGVLGLVTLAMVLVGLVAVSGFIVVAQRRQRQFGLLAATGATERQVRLVLLSGGATIGTAAALLGAVVAVPVWLALVPRLETAGAHRIDRWDVPWWFGRRRPGAGCGDGRGCRVVAGSGGRADAGHPGLVHAPTEPETCSSLSGRRRDPPRRWLCVPAPRRPGERPAGPGPRRRHDRAALPRATGDPGGGRRRPPASGRGPAVLTRPRPSPGPLGDGAGRDQPGPGGSGVRRRRDRGERDPGRSEPL
jgi:hypothetical protein